MDRVQPDSQIKPMAPTAVVVMGVSGSGKSTLGSLLAQELGCRFVEGDELHTPANIEKMSRGEPLNDADRWPWLDRLGKVLHDVVEQEGLVVAACSALKYCYRERLGAAVGAPVAFIMLETDREELSRRLNSRENHYMPASLLASQFDALERPFESERALILDASLPPETLCRASREWLAARG
ncbi:MAG: gluconokinase [Sphingobium sp. 66-54]|nr:MAG: gluconokinase [Sphingobium sp. 66-54]